MVNQENIDYENRLIKINRIWKPIFCGESLQSRGYCTELQHQSKQRGPCGVVTNIVDSKIIVTGRGSSVVTNIMDCVITVSGGAVL